MYLILKHYNIPTLIINQTKSGTILNTKERGYNTMKKSKDYFIIHIYLQKVGKIKEIDLCLNKESSPKILSKDIDNTILKSLITDINKYLNENVKNMEKTRKRNLAKDRVNRIKRYVPVTKVGKTKLPSE